MMDQLLEINALRVHCATEYAKKNPPDAETFGNDLFCDGFGRWYEGPLAYSGTSLTAMAEILPISYSTKLSGVIRLSGNEQSLSLMLDTFGHPVIRLRYNQVMEECVSYETKLPLSVRARLMVSLDGEAGWIHIYVNDIEVGQKQFPRGVCFCFDHIELGYAQEDEAVNHVVPANVLHGSLSEVKIFSDLISDSERGQLLERHMLSPLKPVREEELWLHDQYPEDPNRPRFHMIAAGRWMNEPHAPVYFKGWYHLFYQANPHAPIWDHLQWGHYVSLDMIHWEYRGLAIRTAEEDIDADGIWSGSACLDERGIPALFYTAGKFDQVPNQGVAIARSTYLRDGDEKLTHWEKQRSLLVKQPRGTGRLGEFRDPFVWRQNHRWYMLVGTGEPNFGGGNAAVFTSEDLIDFTDHGLLMDYDVEKHPLGGHCWELPVLLPVGKEKYALLVCSCQVENDCVEVPVWIGNFDPERCRFVPDDPEPGLIDLGHGVFTGPSGFVTPDGRSVVFTIAQGKQSATEEYQQGWAHNAGMPVELFLHTDGQMGVRPIREADSLKGKCLVRENNQTAASCCRSLSEISGDSLCVEICADTDELTWSIDTEGQKLCFRYDRMTGALTAQQNGQPVSRPLRGCDHFPCPNAPIRVQMFVDHNLIECYVNERKSITRRLHRGAQSPMTYSTAFSGTADMTVYKMLSI